jgi:2-amino-4-hydroxy-6-hydroxymethyldihydropteridine diphosphokinase
MADVFLGLGGNEGNREANLRKAMRLLSESKTIKIRAVSSLYETAPVGVENQRDYLNCVVRITARLDPQSLHRATRSIEAALGRQPDTHMMPRLLDIDILLYDDLQLRSPGLTIPHPRMKSRRFVLEPLLEIAPDTVDPSSGRPLREYLGNVMSQRIEKTMDAVEITNDLR